MAASWGSIVVVVIDGSPSHRDKGSLRATRLSVGEWQDLGIFTAVPIVQCRRDDSTRKAVEPGKCNFLLLDRLELDSPGQAIRLLLPEFEVSRC